MTLFSHYVQPLTEWLNTHPHWAGLFTFLISFSESLAVVGTIIPGTVTMTAIGMLVGSGVIPAVPTFLWATLGAVFGDSASYYLGYYFHENIAKMWPFSKHPKILESGKHYFTQHGGKSVLFGRFVGPLRSIIPMIAGMMKMPTARFLIANISSAFAWSFLYIMPGVMLGAVTLDLSPEKATKILVYTLCIILLIWAASWAIKWLLTKSIRFLDTHLELIWQWMKKHPHVQHFAEFISSPTSPGSYTQLGLLVLFILSVFGFIYTAWNVSHQGWLLQANQVIFSVLQSFRTERIDSVAVAITLFSEKWVTLLLILSVFSWLMLKKQRWTAIHWLINGLGIIFAVGLFKHLIISARPAGLAVIRHGSSFPSGHTALAIAVFSFLCYIFASQIKESSRRLVIFPFALLISAVIVSRLYLGAHWLSDIIGSSFLASACVVFFILSHRRQKQSRIALLPIFAISTSALFAGWAIFFYFHFSEQLHAYKPIIATHQLPFRAWWDQDEPVLPLYRKNRLGETVSVMNIQWASSLKHIATSLKHAGWIEKNQQTTADILKNVTSSNKMQQVPLLPQLYHNRRPSLTATYKINDSTPIIVLRLWRSDFKLTDSSIPLWIGSIHYRLLFHHHWHPFAHANKQTKLPLAINYFKPVLDKYQWKTLSIQAPKFKEKSIYLIQEK